jgi:hypothetical protein
VRVAVGDEVAVEEGATVGVRDEAAAFTPQALRRSAKRGIVNQ